MVDDRGHETALRYIYVFRVMYGDNTERLRDRRTERIVVFILEYRLSIPINKIRSRCLCVCLSVAQFARQRMDVFEKFCCL